MAIYDTMQWVSCDVATYCIGQCASMGSLLLAAGAKGKRNALPHGRIMIHQPLAGMEGTATDIMIHAEEFIRMKKQLNQIYQKHTGQTLERLQDDTDRDRFMSPEEAREYGLIDNVVRPRAGDPPEPEPDPLIRIVGSRREHPPGLSQAGIRAEPEAGSGACGDGSPRRAPAGLHLESLGKRSTRLPRPRNISKFFRKF